MNEEMVGQNQSQCEKRIVMELVTSCSSQQVTGNSQIQYKLHPIPDLHYAKLFNHCIQSLQ